MIKKDLIKKFELLVKEYHEVFAPIEKELETLERSLGDLQEEKNKLLQQADELRADMKLTESRRVFKKVSILNEEINELNEDIAYVKETLSKGTPEIEAKLQIVGEKVRQLFNEFQKVVDEANSEKNQIIEDIDKVKAEKIDEYNKKYSELFSLYRKLNPLYNSEYYFKKL